MTSLNDDMGIFKNSLPWFMGNLLILSLPSQSHDLKKQVCVIGAGVTGLLSVKQLADHIDEFEPIVFEKNSDIGGLWIYSDNIGVDQFGLPVHSSLYSNLRSVSPTVLTAIPDYKNFTEGKRSCVHSEVILQYLRNYTRDFGLRQYIQFNTLVEKVSLLSGKDEKESQWLVSTRTAKTNQRNTVICDAVIVCNGHYFKPKIPKIPGIETFPGRILHSHLYRRAEEYKGQTVLLLDAGVSGPDIAVQLSEYAKIIYLSSRHKKQSGKQPTNVIQVPGVVSANNSELNLQDGSKVTADVFIYCTGYLYDYPFLDESSGIKLTNGLMGVELLYKYVVNIQHPSMGFIGMYKGHINFPRFFLQAQYYVAVLRGIVKLPNRTEMLKKVQYSFDWNLYDEYAKDANAEVLPEYYQTASKLWNNLSNVESFYFKEYNLRVLSDGQVEIYK